LRFTNVYIGLLIIILIIIGYIIYVAVIYRRYNKKRYPLYDDKKSDIKGSIKLFFEKERDRLRDELGKSNSCICPEEEDDRSSFREYLGLLPVNMTLSQYQELFRKIGCVRDLNDKDCDKWRKMTSINMVIEDMKNNYKFASKCKGTNEDNEFCFPGRCKKNNLILNVNGPYKYNDGSGVDEQVYPMPIGGIDVEVNGRGYNFPNEMKKLRKLENPFKRILFEIWLMSLHSSGIKMNDPRLKNKLNLLELEVTENAPEPYWREVKLPLVDNMDTNIKKVCQKYNSERKDLGSGPGKFLADTWHFFYQESIPTNIYEKWLKQINISIKNNDDISGVYESFLNEIIESDKFKRKFDNIDNFVMLKLKELISVLGNSFDASEPDSVEFL